MSEWENNNIAQGLGYEDVVVSHALHETKAMEYLHSLDRDMLKLVDLGCGNGRTYLHMKEKLVKPFHYIGIDCNKKLIELAGTIKADDNEFICANLDALTKDDLEKYRGHIFYFDSTLGMIDDPGAILDSIKDVADTIVINRCPVGHTNTENVYMEMQWAGMDKPSPNWLFSREFFKNKLLLHGFNSEKIYNLHRNESLTTLLMIFIKKSLNTKD
jgi:SAM-dependent methyltransferase